MHTVLWIIAGIFAAGVVIALLARLGWGISTQHRDHEAVSEGPLMKRHIWSRRPPRAHAGPTNAAEALPTDPGASVSGQHSDLSAGITQQRR